MTCRWNGRNQLGDRSYVHHVVDVRGLTRRHAQGMYPSQLTTKGREVTSEELKAIVRRHFEETWPKGDVAGLKAATHPEFVNHEAPPGVPAGVDGVQQVMLWLAELSPNSVTRSTK